MEYAGFEEPIDVELPSIRAAVVAEYLVVVLIAVLVAVTVLPLMAGWPWWGFLTGTTALAVGITQAVGRLAVRVLERVSQAAVDAALDAGRK